MVVFVDWSFKSPGLACPESCVWSSRGTSPHDPGVGAQTGPGNHTHTCADAVRTGHSLSTHTIREHSRAREEEGGSREIAHDSDDGVEQAARSCEPTATRAFGVSAIWMDRTFCYACCPPLLTLKDNLHSGCAAISDYPSRPSSPADRWLYLLIGPLRSFTGVRGPLCPLVGQ